MPPEMHNEKSWADQQRQILPVIKASLVCADCWCDHAEHQEVTIGSKPEHVLRTFEFCLKHSAKLAEAMEGEIGLRLWEQFNRQVHRDATGG